MATFRVFTTCNERQGTYAHSGESVKLSNVGYRPFEPYVKAGACNDPNVNVPIDKLLRNVVSDGQLSVETVATTLWLMNGSSRLAGGTDP